MSILTSLFTSVGLAMDAFAVSLGIGTTGQARTIRPVFRLSFHLGFFQGLMTFLGWLAGSTVADIISSFDHWVAMALLSIVGLRMVRSGLDPKIESQRCDASRGVPLLMICIATSIDAMAIGLSLAMLGGAILIPSLIIGLVTLGLSLFGLLAGGFLGVRFGKRMEILGGLLLNGIGIQILLTHIL